MKATINTTKGQIRVTRDANGLVYELPSGMTGQEFQKVKKANKRLIQELKDEEQTEESDSIGPQ